jgi:nicotinate (nicotinamide) nucleotide adenylyltransferase
MKNSRKRIGIFGGTFDPPHKGHIAIAEQAKTQLGLDCVYFIPAYIPPHKHQNSSTSAQHRMKMMRLAVSGRKEFNVSTIELRRRGISYTINTLKAFKRRFPKAELVLIIGADNLAQFNLWKSPKTILQIASLVVYKRKGFGLSLKESTIDFILLEGRMLRVSSTEIRRKITKGMSISTLIPKSVRFYIEKHLLYRPSRSIIRNKII